MSHRNHTEQRRSGMAYLTKAQAERTVKVRVRRSPSGREQTAYEAYLGMDPFTHRAVRVTRATRADLSKAISEFHRRLSSGGEAAASLTAEQALDARIALAMLAGAGSKASLRDAAAALISASGAPAQGGCVSERRTAMEAAEEYLATKERGGADWRLVRATVVRWAKTCADADVSSATARGMLAYLEGSFADSKPKTYNTHLQYLSTFFNWCTREERGYAAANPMRSLRRREEPWEEPEYMSPADAERMLRLMEAEAERRPELLAFAVLSLFCGSRSVEIVRMASPEGGARIDLDDETVRIAKGKGFQRGRRPRAFRIHPTALAWMRSFDFMRGVSRIGEGTQGEVYRIAREAGVPVFQNCGRHTFITMHIAAYGDPARTQAMVGTSAKMRADNYCGLASHREGEAFFAIMPAGAAQSGAPAA